MMKIEQIYTGCLAQGAYYIESDGEVAIIDPLREVQSYIDMANKSNSKIKYVFETHFHADFVSGHLTLSNKTGADIIYGPNANTNFKAVIAKDNQEFKLGKAIIKVIHTPGHTMESTTYLLIDEKGKDYALFTGDTLFLGDVGRPDLAQKSASLTQEQLAETLYDSLRNKIMPLSDDLIIYPGHGAGSACGKNLSKETTGILGEQKQNNYALRDNMTKAEFVKEVTNGLLPPPEYFPLNVKMNKEGYKDIADVIAHGTHELLTNEVEKLANTGALVLDVRTASEFAEGHIPNSIFIGLDGGFAPWVGALIGDVEQAIVLVIPDGREEETITRLSRVGFDNTLGYLKGGFDTWKTSGKEYDTVDSISANNFKDVLTDKTLVFDVRKETEFISERLHQSKNIPLSNVNLHLKDLPLKENFYIHCAGGYRSMIAASILKSRGIHNFTDISGGFKSIKESGVEVTNYVCPSTL